MLHQGKVAIVTGAAQGIGRACAERLAREGAKVVIADLNGAEAKAVENVIAKSGGTGLAQACNVSKKADVDALIAAALEAYGRIDLLVNNAGVVDDCPFLELPEDEFDRIIGTNLKGAFLVGQAAAREMARQARPGPGEPAGAIVNMSSVNAWFGLPDHAAYSMSKGGIMQLTKAMAISLAPLGIRVNAVGPGTIDTPLIKDVVKDAAFRKKVLSRTPLGRFGEPSEIAAIVAWLLSKEASYVTGTTVYADGGRMPLNYVMPVED